MLAQEYVLRVPLPCVDTTTHIVASLASGSVVTYVSPGQGEGMVVLSCRGREILAFAVDFKERAESISPPDALSHGQPA